MLSLSQKDKSLALVLTEYIREKEPNRQDLPLGRVIFIADKFFRWLFAPSSEYIGKNESRSRALIIAEHFFKSDLIVREMGRSAIIHYFRIKKAATLLKEVKT